jgi:hypothetical protein
MATILKYIFEKANEDTSSAVSQVSNKESPASSQEQRVTKKKVKWNDIAKIITKYAKGAPSSTGGTLSGMINCNELLSEANYKKWKEYIDAALPYLTTKHGSNLTAVIRANKIGEMSRAELWPIRNQMEIKVGVNAFRIMDAKEIQSDDSSCLSGVWRVFRVAAPDGRVGGALLFRKASENRFKFHTFLARPNRLARGMESFLTQTDKYISHTLSPDQDRMSYFSIAQIPDEQSRVLWGIFLRQERLHEGSRQSAIHVEFTFGYKIHDTHDKNDIRKGLEEYCDQSPVGYTREECIEAALKFYDNPFASYADRDRVIEKVEAGFGETTWRYDSLELAIQALEGDNPSDHPLDKGHPLLRMLKSLMINNIPVLHVAKPSLRLVAA